VRRFFSIIRFAAIVAALACFGASFVLDMKYANNPTTPNAAEGRIYSRPIRGQGNIYLTASEYAPYQLLPYAMGGCLAVAALAFLIESMAAKKP
jgi:hypothetical protein